MTHEELQNLIDAVDEAVNYLPLAHQKALKVVSNLLVDLPDEVVVDLNLREPEGEE